MVNIKNTEFEGFWIHEFKVKTMSWKRLKRKTFNKYIKSELKELKFEMKLFIIQLFNVKIDISSQNC